MTTLQPLRFLSKGRYNATTTRLPSILLSRNLNTTPPKLIPQVASRPFRRPTKFTKEQLTPIHELRPAKSPARIVKTSSVTIDTDPVVHIGFHGYLPVGIRPLTEETQRILSEPVRGEDLDIHPEVGWVYLKYTVYQDRLNRAFGEDAWKLIPTSNLQIREKSQTHYRSYALFVNEIFISEAIGDAQPDRGVGKNDPQFSCLEERCRYMALVRCCKDIGVALELWEKQTADQLKFANFSKLPVQGSSFRPWGRKEKKV